MKIEEAKELEMDESELLDLLDFDDDMWLINVLIIALNYKIKSTLINR